MIWIAALLLSQLPLTLFALGKNGGLVTLLTLVWVFGLSYLYLAFFKDLDPTKSQIKRPFLFALITFLITRVLIVLLNLNSGQTTTNDQNLITILTRLTYPKLMIVIMIGIITPIIEEVIYRGMFYGLFQDKRYAFVLGTLLFMMIHTPTSPLEMMIYLTLSLGFNVIYYKTDRLDLTISMHILNNIIPVIIVVYGAY